MNASPSDLLVRHAPEPGEPNEDILASIDRGGSHTGGRQPRGGALPRRLGYAVTAIAASTALAFGVQAVLHRPPAASAVERLAEAAGKQPATEVPAGSYLYQSEVQRFYQPGMMPWGDGDTLREWWIDSEGKVWEWVTLPNGEHDDARTPYGTPDVPQLSDEPYRYTLTPAELNKLPTDPAALLATFKKGFDGDSLSADESLSDDVVFGRIIDAIAWGGTTGAINQAAIQALAMIPETTSRLTSDVESRPCLEIGYAAQPERELDYYSACFDQQTGRLLELGVGEPESRIGTVTLRDRKIVTSIPPELIQLGEDAKASSKDYWNKLRRDIARGEKP